MVYPDKGTFLTHMGIRSLNVAGTLATIFRNNKKLVGKISEGEIGHVFSLLQVHGKMARWLRLLASYLTVKDKPHLANQNRVLKQVLAHSNVVNLYTEPGATGTSLFAL